MAAPGFKVMRRKRNGKLLRNWEVRIYVPRDWRSALGSRSPVISLKTEDEHAAHMRAPAVVARQLEEWRKMLDRPFATPTIVDPEGLGVSIGYDELMEILEAGARSWPKDDLALEANLQQREVHLRRLNQYYQDRDFSPFREIADRKIANHGLGIVIDSEEYDRFLEALAVAIIDAFTVHLKRRRGEIEAGPSTATVKKVKATAATKAEVGETLLDLFDLWAEEQLATGAKRDDTVKQDRKAMVGFAEFIGIDRNVRSITPLEVAEYRDALRALPPKWMSMNVFKGMGIREAAKKAAALGKSKTSFNTVNKHLSTISPLYKWLAKQPKWAGLSNPCAGLFYPKVKGKNPRPPFTTDQLNRILQSPLFTGYRSEGLEHIQGECRNRDWKFWIPLVALFTGARIGEVAQLAIGDVCLEKAVWFAHIKHDEKAGKATKNRASRPVPLHEKLKEIGFLDFRQARLDAEEGNLKARLFTGFEKNARGQISGTPSRWWRDYLEKIGVKESIVGGDGKGAHSFRHALADRFRSEAELMDNEIAVFLGHRISSTTSGYGQLPQGTVTKLKKWIDDVTFEDVKFDHLVPKD